MELIKKIQNRLNHEWEKLTFRPHVIKRVVDGEDIEVYINNLFAKHWYHNGHHWPEMKWIKEKMLVPGDIVCDCGANNGYTSVFFSKAVKEKGKVYAFEPHPVNTHAIQKNIKLNHANNIVLVGKAVGSENAILKLSEHPNGTITDNTVDVIEVEVVKLDDFFQDKPLPTFLKIDVEGYEVEVLKGAKRILASYPKLDIEIHCGNFSSVKTLDELFDLIDTTKYHSFIQMNVDGEIEPFNWSVHTKEKMLTTPVVHFFAIPVKN